MKSHITLIVTLLGLVLIAGLFFPSNPLIAPTQANVDPCDEDQDGYISTACDGNDCNDFDSSVNPGATENCTDGQDNDCDGDTDMQATQAECDNAGWLWIPEDCLCQANDCGIDGARERECNDAGWLWIPEECFCSSATPIIFDMMGNGCRLTDAHSGVDFDINGDGRTERLSWTAADTDDAFLGLDRNGNGVIDGGPELFGNFTDQPSTGDRNGFIALAEFDKSENGGNADGMISGNDAVFSSLLLWEDSNHNGASEPAEIHSLADHSITAIELRYRTSNKSDMYGNVFRYRAKVHDVSGPSAGRWVWDVVLLVQ